VVIPEQGVDPSFADRSAASRGVVVAVMAVLPVFLAGALAVQLREELDFGTAALGGLTATYFVTSAVASPVMGQVVERLGAGRAAALAATTSALAMVGAGTASSWWQLALALTVAGLGNSVAQPAANLLLSDSIPVRRLGLAFGIKQSCVPAAALVGGLAVPTVALVLGWRWAFLIAGVATGCFGAWLLLRHAPRVAARSERTRLRDSEAPITSLLFLTAGGFLGAAAATSLGAFLVDSAVSSGFAPSSAGWLYAALAWGTVVSRIGLGWGVDRAPTRSRFGVIAALLALGSVGYLLLAAGERPVLFVVGAALGFSVGWAWTGLFHYAIVTWYRRSAAAATGFVQTGLSLGAGLGPLGFGVIVQHGGYTDAWLAAGAVSLAAGLTVLGARNHLRAARRRPAG
jgi:MFS family permease